MTALTSARLQKVRWRNRPSSHLSTMSTACSIFALSLGFLGCAGKASSCQRRSSPSRAVWSGFSFFAGWRDILGTMPATSQLD